MVTVDEFSRLVSGIYAAAITPEHWEVAIRNIHRTLGAAGGGLLMADGAAMVHRASTLPMEAAQRYAEYYHRFDRVVWAVERGPIGTVRTGAELIPLVRRSEFYDDWLRPLDINDGLFIRLTDGPNPPCFIVTAPKRTESFDSPERVKLANGLIPHLQQALRTQRKLAALDRSSAGLAGPLEAVRHGMVIVGPDWWVITLNAAAERILRAEDGLQMCSARIAATSIPVDRTLHRALHAALVGDGSTIRSSRSFLCERPSGKRPYVVHVLPLHRAEADETSSEAEALVLIVDPEQESEPAATLLRRLYGFTRSEADVAVRIAGGADLKEIADELSVSITTVRKHLQHLFEKTNTHRQAELVQLLLTLRP